MRVLIYDDFELQDMIYDYEKLVSGQKFRGYGKFNLIMQNLEYVDTAKIGRIAIVKDEAFFIEDIMKYKDLEQKEKFVLKGSHINKLLDRRVSMGDVSVNKNETYEVQIRRLIESNFINVDAKRKIDCFKLASIQGLKKKPTIDYVIKRDKISKIIDIMCENADMGYCIEFDAKNKRFIFCLKEMIDKTKAVFFSEEYGNATNSELQIITGSVANVCYYGTTQKGEAVGLDRIETFVTEEDIGSAIEELNKSKAKESVVSDILLTEQFEYEQDWDLGDIVTFFDNSVGFKVEKPILEINEIYSKTFDLEVVFGERNRVLG